MDTSTQITDATMQLLPQSERGRRRIRLADPLSRSCGRVALGAGLAFALVTGMATVDGASASAEPAAPDADAMSSPPTPRPIPSSPAAVARTADGWTLTLSASNETLNFLAPPDPARPTRDFIVAGLFNGTLHGPGNTTTPRPSGTIEVGYETHCLASGLVAAINPGYVKTEVLQQDFNGADVSTAIGDFNVHVDCMGPALVRSYAVLTRTTSATNTVVAYYGVPTHV